MDILKNGERYYFPVFTSAAEMKEYGKKFYQREVYISDAINMAKESRYVLTGLVINAFTDSVILNWDQLAQEFLMPMRKKKPCIRDNNSDVKICVECYSRLCNNKNTVNKKCRKPT